MISASSVDLAWDSCYESCYEFIFQGTWWELRTWEYFTSRRLFLVHFLLEFLISRSGHPGLILLLFCFPFLLSTSYFWFFFSRRFFLFYLPTLPWSFSFFLIYIFLKFLLSFPNVSFLLWCSCFVAIITFLSFQGYYWGAFYFLFIVVIFSKITFPICFCCWLALAFLKILIGASQMAQWLHQPMLGLQETWVQSLGQEDPPEKEMATQSRIPAWKIPLVGYTVHGVTKSQTLLSHWAQTQKPD